MNNQKQLTKEQLDVLRRLEAILKESEEKHIGFVFDYADGTISAFNAENIEYCYLGREKDNDHDKEMKWDVCYILNDIPIDSFDSNYKYYFVKFKEEE